jgi:teichuronic acid biosynthesis glycosyltransferase TuaC
MSAAELKGLLQTAMPLKILTFSTLYPNAAKPHHGIFTETALRHQIATGELEAKVVAPVPWFPFSHEIFGEYGVFARAPARETRVGVEIFHPRYVALPKVNMYLAPFSIAHSAKSVLGRLLDEGYDFDVIDAHYFFPDGVAAALLGKYFGKPVVISALGTDVNVIMKNPTARKMILWASEQAASVTTVCQSLKATMVGLGMNDAGITPLRNGVDLELFKPVNRLTMRKRLEMDRFTLLSVGHLRAVKGHHHVIAALKDLPDVALMIAGSGPDRKRLEAQVLTLGVGDRVTFLGALPQEQLREYYGAADALVLASDREGWANVLLEAMACGTPVVATAVGGTPEVVRSSAAGVLIASPTPENVTEGVRCLRASYPDHAATRAYAEAHGWAETTRAQLRLFRHAAHSAIPDGVLSR